MKKYLLAVLFGAIFGLGLTVFPSGTSSLFGEKQELALISQPQPLRAQDVAALSSMDLRAGMIGVMIGTVVAVMAFWIAVRKTR